MPRLVLKNLPDAGMVAGMSFSHEGFPPRMVVIYIPQKNLGANALKKKRIMSAKFNGELSRKCRDLPRIAAICRMTKKSHVGDYIFMLHPVGSSVFPLCLMQMPRFVFL